MRGAPRVPRVALSEQEKGEIRQLRTQDPETWSQRALAARYNCSRLLIAMVAPRAAEAVGTAPATPADTAAPRRKRRALRNLAADLRRQKIQDALGDPSTHGL